MLDAEIKKIAKSCLQEIIAIRRHIHENPELSFQEFKTSSFLKNKLNEWGIAIDKEWVKTGFTIVIDSGKAGKCIGLRADLDALPIQEEAAISFASKNKGLMHACGHDVHASSLMGVAKVLSETKEHWKGKVVLIFQAGEEKLPGGASLMIKEGMLEYYNFDCMFAQHVYPEFNAGIVGFKGGMYMASADEIYLKVVGKGGHAALPHNNVDPIVIASNIIVQLQQVASRIAPPTVPTVLSFGKIVGNGATNVIPNEVLIEGTLRTMNEEWRAIYHSKIEEIAFSTAKSFGGECVVDIQKGYPFLVNDEALSSFSKNTAINYLGENNVKDLGLRMTAEDFAYFSQEVPTCFYRLGIGFPNRQQNFSVHHPQFEVNEEAMETAIGLMSYLAVSELNK